jgi:SAM-dependent methyltransferase
MTARERARRTWDELARTDPWRAILGRPGQGPPWDPEAFFALGDAEIGAALEYAARLGLPRRRARALDFGCGAGRLTQALAAHFDEVTGVDVSPEMIELARRHNRRGDRCRFTVNDRPDLGGFPDASFDLVYSNITLQHLRPAEALAYLAEFLRVLTPGGLALVSLPSNRIRPAVARLLPGRLNSWLSRWAWRLLHPGRPVIEMHGIPSKRVIRFLESRGGRVIEASPVDSAGAAWLTVRYAVTR